MDVQSVCLFRDLRFKPNVSLDAGSLHPEEENNSLAFYPAIEETHTSTATALDNTSMHGF